MRSISINRAPVLTLWASVVAQRLGFDEDEGLTLGKALARLNAQAKGRRLGNLKPHEEKAKKAREKEPGQRFWIEVLGRPVPATNTDDGIRAVRGRNPIDPDSVRRYLEDKFGDDLKAVRSAMQKLAKADRPQELAHDAYSLYESFRPDIPAGKKGWDAKGNLDLGRIGRLAKGEVISWRACSTPAANRETINTTRAVPLSPGYLQTRTSPCCQVPSQRLPITSTSRSLWQSILICSLRTSTRC
jgi:hypothetical protein